MSTATDSLALARAHLAHHFGQVATYRRADDSDVELTDCMPNTRPDAQVYVGVDLTDRNVAVFVVRAAKITTPIRGERITFAGGDLAGEWLINIVHPLTGGDHEVLAIKQTATNTQAEHLGDMSPVIS